MIRKDKWLVSQLTLGMADRWWSGKEHPITNLRISSSHSSKTKRLFSNQFKCKVKNLRSNDHKKRSSPQQLLNLPRVRLMTRTKQQMHLSRNLMLKSLRKTRSRKPRRSTSTSYHAHAIPKMNCLTHQNNSPGQVKRKNQLTRRKMTPQVKSKVTVQQTLRLTVKLTVELMVRVA